MLKIILLLTLVNAFPLSFAESSPINVHILSRYHPQELVIATKSRVFHLDTSLKNQFFFRAAEGEEITINVNGSFQRKYQGSITVTSGNNELRVENETPLEVYVAGVVAGEFGGGAAPEFIKAQAILARTYALNKISNTELSDLAYHQVFKGVSLLTKKYERYSRQTEGIVLNDSGKLADIMYHAECGSSIYHANEFWKVSSFSLQPLPLSPGMRQGESWKVFLSKEKIENVFPNVSSLKRSTKAPIIIDLGTLQKNVESFRLGINRQYGWTTVPSNEFSIQPVPNGWILKGRGRGHLVGMCQQQANQLASEGWQYDNLLELFYPTLQLNRL